MNGFSVISADLVRSAQVLQQRFGWARVMWSDSVQAHVESEYVQPFVQQTDSTARGLDAVSAVFVDARRSIK